MSEPSVLAINNYGTVRGGSDRYFIELAELLARKGHAVARFHTAPPGGPAGLPVEQGLARPTPRLLYSTDVARRLRTLLGASRPDIAHLHIYYGQLTSSILPALSDAGVPVVQTLHDYKLVCPTYTLNAHGEICERCQGSHFWHAIEQRCNRGSLLRSTASAAESYFNRLVGGRHRVDHFIAVSDFVRHKMIELGIDAGRISTLHNFIDLTGIDADYRPGQHLLFFGRMEGVKGLRTLLAAAALVPHVPVVLAGTGSIEAELRAEATRAGLANVRFVGFQTGAALEALIRGAVATLLPSEWYETFGLVALESFARGRPVLATAIGGIPEVVEHGSDGWLVEPRAPEALAERMDWFWTRRADDAPAMGRRGRARTEARFNSDVHYRGLMEIYRKVGVA